MSAVKHSGSHSHAINSAQAYRELQHYEKWHQTPKWHWRYWFGYRMRKGDLHPYDPETKWEYRTYGDHARRILEEKYDVGAEQQKADRPGSQRRPSANYVGSP